MGRPAANTKLGHSRVHPVRCRGGNMKYRALRLDTGNFSWGTEGERSYSIIVIRFLRIAVLCFGNRKGRGICESFRVLVVVDWIGACGCGC